MSEQPTEPSQPRGPNGKWIYTPEGAERDAEAARLRARGLSYRAIAAELGVDLHTAHNAVKRALAAIVQEPAEDVRRMELERLDALYEAAMGVLEREHVTVSQGKIIYQGDEPLLDDGPVLQAIDRLLRIQERRAKLLGLDAATKTQVSGGVRYELVGIDPEQLK
ncbi:helix-turn-helix domain-containing protein [Streptomyces sparsogenes]|uniref:helix-turn-helix domain-containing protein n=1 Tax=Streptomyces sparsogenes TaxID=67365 RepID=UPI0033FBFEBC